MTSVLKLDLQYFAGEKTEKATPKKRQDTRKKGQVAKSSDVNTAFVLIAVFLCLLAIGPWMKTQVTTLFVQTFHVYILEEVTVDKVHLIFIEILMQVIWIVGPVMLAAAIGALFSNFVQVGPLFSTEAIHMKLNKLDPIQGFKRIYSVRAIVEFVKSMLKIVFIGIITFSILWISLEDVLILSQKNIHEALAFLGSLTIKMGLFAGGALLFLSVFDYFYQKYDYEKNIRMSKHDVKDEYKKSEGDPLIKSKIKQKQREMSMQRMMQDVPNADVVITNPTHYAIAIKYDEKKGDAPIVLAKGVDFVALKIKEKAAEHKVITVENKPLARALYSQAEIGDVIPEDFFQAVAEILAYVYRLQNQVK
ncbi:flagellar biosynthesis protein FlhB [Sutcliffiella rhizosphaerae]|uniref:Flagellar biosynthetic protein FlhB n=1 Tax=Sutcliffiella rhizosphaerae TaxID=2880967 RepID=A0ABN8A3H2_9BACI|nr:flagellar biosynthesis protein FlhB [Sutcliffiella rhizosphaerae]CAG9619696.1 Flagellar biosynthetic protein FlhB [Sutcliffiella rhizosphaerae]